jgi:DEAD/DEAH box helicase domain-containing protein
MNPFAELLLQHRSIAPMVVHHRRLPGASAEFAEPREPLAPPLAEALKLQGFERLYRHQAEGLDRLREGRDLLLVTPTASGKTLLFSMAVLESLRQDPASKALLIYPTKALARDQLTGFRSLAGGLGALRPPRFEIYDGDTPQSRRRKIRSDPPEALITNPDMLHMGLLSHHQAWEPFLRGLRWIVLDELHVYRGIFGAHVHHILARLQRLCARLGARPRFIAASATVGNPGEFASTLAGREFAVVQRSGAPRSAREVLFLNPRGVSPYTAALRVISESVRAGLSSIAFTKARRVTELLHTWLVQQEPELRGRVAPYRAGYLPEERRRLEARLFRGELSAILSTSALELGIDVGGLDACILVGYPGSLISSWQRIGRVGRERRDGLVVLVAMPDALDQYVVRHPDLFFGGEFEKAVLDPWNPLVAGQHLTCAAAEEPLAAAELESGAKQGRAVVDSLVREGRLVQDRDGARFFSFRRRPHRDVNPRSAGEPFTIVNARSGGTLGSIDGKRVYHECHPGAIYLHAGQSFLVRELDAERRKVLVESARVDYYTVVLGDKETEILERLASGSVGSFRTGLGRLKVTVRIREYQKKRLFDGEPISNHPLDVPPLIFETIGFWVELPPGMAAAFTARDLHFMGGIHAVEHALIGLFPLLAISDRDDMGGISYTGHPQTGGPAVFVYDAFPGGAGLAQRGFADLDSLVRRALELLSACPCEDGCPGCIQSPKCGNGNKPLDKNAALLLLRALAGEAVIELPEEGAEAAALPAPAPPSRARRHGIVRAGNLDPEVAARVRAGTGSEKLPAPPEQRPAERPGDDSRGDAAAGDAPGRRRERSSRLVMDLETQRSAEEVGGWGHTDRMGLALAVVYDIERESYRTYFETDASRLLLDLVMADRVVGFNIDRFDLRVLSAYTEWDLGRIRTLDLLGVIHARLGFRLSLAHLSEVNLGESKAGDGLQSLVWWKEGRIDLIEQYCRKDVDLTRRLYELGRQQGYLLYRDHSRRVVRVPVAW